jgi:hypothetical protein
MNSAKFRSTNHSHLVKPENLKKSTVFIEGISNQNPLKKRRKKGNSLPKNSSMNHKLNCLYIKEMKPKRRYFPQYSQYESLYNPNNSHLMGNISLLPQPDLDISPRTSNSKEPQIKKKQKNAINIQISPPGMLSDQISGRFSAQFPNSAGIKERVLKNGSSFIESGTTKSTSNKKIIPIEAPFTSYSSKQIHKPQTAGHFKKRKELAHSIQLNIITNPNYEAADTDDSYCGSISQTHSHSHQSKKKIFTKTNQSKNLQAYNSTSSASNYKGKRGSESSPANSNLSKKTSSPEPSFSLNQSYEVEYLRGKKKLTRNPMKEMHKMNKIYQISEMDETKVKEKIENLEMNKLKLEEISSSSVGGKVAPARKEEEKEKTEKSTERSRNNISSSPSKSSQNTRSFTTREHHHPHNHHQLNPHAILRTSTPADTHSPYHVLTNNPFQTSHQPPNHKHKHKHKDKQSNAKDVNLHLIRFNSIELPRRSLLNKPSNVGISFLRIKSIKDQERVCRLSSVKRKILFQSLSPSEHLRPQTHLLNFRNKSVYNKQKDKDKDKERSQEKDKDKEQPKGRQAKENEKNKGRLFEHEKPLFLLERNLQSPKKKAYIKDPDIKMNLESLGIDIEDLNRELDGSDKICEGEINKYIENIKKKFGLVKKSTTYSKLWDYVHDVLKKKVEERNKKGIIKRFQSDPNKKRAVTTQKKARTTKNVLLEDSAASMINISQENQKESSLISLERSKINNTFDNTTSDPYKLGESPETHAGGKGRYFSPNVYNFQKSVYESKGALTTPGSRKKKRPQPRLLSQSTMVQKRRERLLDVAGAIESITQKSPRQDTNSSTPK